MLCVCVFNEESTGRVKRELESGEAVTDSNSPLHIWGLLHPRLQRPPSNWGGGILPCGWPSPWKPPEPFAFLHPWPLLSLWPSLRHLLPASSFLHSFPPSSLLFLSSPPSLLIKSIYWLLVTCQGYFYVVQIQRWPNQRNSYPDGTALNLWHTWDVREPGRKVRQRGGAACSGRFWCRWWEVARYSLGFKGKACRLADG